MNDNYSQSDWEKIKALAARLQAIISLLQVFDEQVNGKWFANDLKPIQEQLQAEFNETLQALIELIEAGDNA